MYRNIKLKLNVGLASCNNCKNTTDFSLNSVGGSFTDGKREPASVWLRCACGNEPPAEHRTHYLQSDPSVNMLRTAMNAWNVWLAPAEGIPSSADSASNAMELTDDEDSLTPAIVPNLAPAPAAQATMTYLNKFPPTADGFEACTHVVAGRNIIGVSAKSNRGKLLAITGNQGAADEDESMGNAFLFAEAGNVFRKYQVGPAELAANCTSMLALFTTLMDLAKALPQQTRADAEPLISVMEKANAVLPRLRERQAAAAAAAVAETINQPTMQEAS